MNPNPFGRTFWVALGIMVAAVATSAVASVSESLRMPAFFLLAAAFAVTAVARWNVAALVLLGEMFIGSYGRLLTVSVHGYSVSLRYAFFAIFIIVWVLRLLLRKEALPQLPKRAWQLLGVLAVALAAGVVVGIVRGNSMVNVFNDANAYGYLLLLLPIVTSLGSAAQKSRLVQVLAAAVTAITVQTLVLLAIFSHQYSSLRTAYRWVRNTRMDEVTQVGYNFVRVFSPAQLYSLVGFFFFLFLALFARSLTRRQRGGVVALCALALTTVLVSMSRTFWIAFAVGLIAAFVILLRHGWAAGQFAVLAGRGLMILAGSLLIISFTANYPYLLNRPGAPMTFSFFTDRSLALDEAAIYSRYDLIVPMLSAGIARPFLGSGFGTTVTFTSHDPRALAVNNGLRTTYAFEWGYLDIWLKTGLFGLVIFLVALVSLCRTLWRAASQTPESRGVLLGFFLAVIAVAASHVTSPYLNHPLGLGVSVIAAAYVLAVRQPAPQRPEP